jgi:hypothetical protein
LGLPTFLLPSGLLIYSFLMTLSSDMSVGFKNFFFVSKKISLYLTLKTCAYVVTVSDIYWYVHLDPIMSALVQLRSLVRLYFSVSYRTAFPNLWSADHRWSATMGEVVRRWIQINKQK